MNKTLGSLIAVVLIGSLIPHQASAARGGGRGGGGGHMGGGGGAHFNAGGGGAHFNGGGGAAHFNAGGAAHFNAARPSFGHTPTFSVPHTMPRENFNVARPNFENHLNIASRPNIENRPNIANRPNVANRPNFENRPGIENRPNADFNRGIGERGNPFERGNEFVNRSGIAARPTIENRFGGGDFNHAGGIARAGYGNWYHGDWHNNWNHSWYHRPIGWWGPNWWGAGYYPGYAAWTSPWAWGYYNYYNPYYTSPALVADAVVDYAQPLALAGGAVAPPQTAQDQAMQIFNTARDTFMRGDYPLALTQINQALGLLPSDVVLNEFRGLCLFALHQYPDAAATMYAVLSAGPGWDWTTLSNLYPDTDVYTAQLRALEQYVRVHPQDADTRFLLGYQYLTCGYTTQAATQFAAAAQLNPKDQLSAQLVASLQAPNSSAGAPGAVATGTPPPPSSPTGFATTEAPVQPANPVTAAEIAGNWQATRPDGGKISLSLGNDSKYDWRYTVNGKTQDFNGTYQLADNVLILRQGTNPAMVGQVTPEGNSGFNFKVAGDNPSDPGVTFRR